MQSGITNSKFLGLTLPFLPLVNGVAYAVIISVVLFVILLAITCCVICCCVWCARRNKRLVLYNAHQNGSVEIKGRALFL